MGADTTSTQLVFFISATLVAVAAAGTLTGIVHNLANTMSVRGAAVEAELTSSIEVVNDPRRVVTSPKALFYVKNTGQTTLDANETAVILDGRLVKTNNTLLNGARTFAPGALLLLEYTASAQNPPYAIGAGDHTLRVSMQNGAHDEFSFRTT